MQSLDIRFRHPGGDLGPFSFETNVNVLNLKERLLSEWPTGAVSVRARVTTIWR